MGPLINVINVQLHIHNEELFWFKKREISPFFFWIFKIDIEIDIYQCPDLWTLRTVFGLLLDPVLASGFEPALSNMFQLLTEDATQWMSLTLPLSSLHRGYKRGILNVIYINATSCTTMNRRNRDKFSLQFRIKVLKIKAVHQFNFHSYS